MRGTMPTTSGDRAGNLHFLNIPWGKQVYNSHSFQRNPHRELARRIEFCYTPKHGSWLHIAENDLSAMTRQCLSGRRIGDLGTLQSEIAAWSTDVNDRKRGVDWRMTITDARCKLKSIYPKIKL